MQKISVQRRGSFLYARAYMGMAAGLTIVYLLIGTILALVAANTFDRATVGIGVFLLVLSFVGALWLFYLAILWLFRKESSQTVEITAEGVREMRDGREFAFIPWDGVMELELAATVVAGASLRIKGNFSEISISNVDLVITREMGLRELHRALGRTYELRELFKELVSLAPHASFRMNRLARRRLGKYEWIKS
jgi:hypothetical protein